MPAIALTPASGNRTNTTGALGVVGSRGYYWSSAPVSASSASVSILRFLTDEMTVLYSNGRAYAFPVRCVQHLQAAFIFFGRGALASETLISF